MSVHHGVMWSPKALVYLIGFVWASGFILGVWVTR